MKCVLHQVFTKLLVQLDVLCHVAANNKERNALVYSQFAQWVELTELECSRPVWDARAGASLEVPGLVWCAKAYLRCDGQ